jgi:hypothetical protein
MAGEASPGKGKPGGQEWLPHSLYIIPSSITPLSG